MQPRLAVILVLVGMTSGGCRICPDCEDLDYPAYGGSWQRTIRKTGRVGSVFDPAGGKVPQLVDRTVPESPDQVERDRQSDGDLDPPGPELTPPGFDGQDTPDPPEDTGSPGDSGQPFRPRDIEDVDNDLNNEPEIQSLDDIQVQLVPHQAPHLISLFQ